MQLSTVAKHQALLLQQDNQSHSTELPHDVCKQERMLAYAVAVLQSSGFYMLESQ